MSIYQRKTVLEKLKAQFEEHKFPSTISLQAYQMQVENPVLRREIKKTYTNWARLMRALQIKYPELFVKEKAAQPAPAPAPADPLKALKKAKEESVDE